MTDHEPIPALTVRVHLGVPYWEALFRSGGKPVKRRIGRAWLTQTADGWTAKRGRAPLGAYTRDRAAVRAREVAAEYAAQQAEREDGRDTVTFAAVAADYMRWLQRTGKAKPSTLKDYGYALAADGRIMRAIGTTPAAAVTTRDVEALLDTVAGSGASPRTVNKSRQLVRAIFYYGMREATFGLPRNPATETTKRREAPRPPVAFYSPSEIEQLARSMETGAYRQRRPANHQRVDAQDAAWIRVAAYAGLRMGEMLALRWRDIDFAGHKITVQRAVSDKVEASPKSNKIRTVPLTDQAAAALDRLSRRRDYTSPDDLVFVNELGRRIDRYSLRERYIAARDHLGLAPLRLHDLRHTYGSLLAAAGIDLVAIQAAMGHSALATTSIYLHARPASTQAAAFSAAFAVDTADELLPVG